MYRLSHGKIASKFSQNERWKDLSVPLEYFNGCRRHPVFYLPAEGYNRTCYFYECDSISFRVGNAKEILEKKGSGEIEVPANVGVLIRGGKYKN